MRIPVFKCFMPVATSVVVGTAVVASAGQGVQRMLYTSPNVTFVEKTSGEIVTMVNDTSGSISTLQTSINNARSANPTNVIVIRLLTNATYIVSSAGIVLGSHECLVASGATIRAADATVTVPLITISSGATNVSVAGGLLDGNGANIQGIYAAAAKRVNVDKVAVQNCGQDCILLKGQGNSTYDNEMTVTRCEASGSAAHAGISIQNSTQTAVLDNYCHNNFAGIYISCAWATVANNVCNNNATGIDIAGGNDNVVANNTCNNNATGIHAVASNNMIVSNSQGTNSTAGINSNGSGNTFADNLFTGGGGGRLQGVNFSSAGSGNNVIAYKTNLTASGQNYFYPPLIDDQHTNTIVGGKGRADITISSTTIDSVQTQYNSALAANPTNVIVLHLNGTFTVGATALTLQSNTCVLLNGTIQINSSTAASAAIAGGTTPRNVSISGGVIDGGNLTGNNGISIGNAAMIQLDAVTLRNFGDPNTRKGGSDVVHLSGGATPQVITRCYLTNGAARGIWFQTSGIKRVVSDTEATQINQDGVDCDSSTSGSVVKFCYCHDLVRYGVFFEQSASHNLALGNICNDDGRDINLYNNSTTPRGDTAFNSVLCNWCLDNNALRNGSTGTNVVQTSHNFLFNNTVVNASINSETYGTENYYSQNYRAGGSLSTAGTESFFNSTGVSSNLYLLDNSGLPALVQGAAITNNAPVVTGAASGLDNDLWALIPTDSGYYRITNKKSKLVMNVSGASLSAGAAIIQFSFGSGKNDQWMPMSAGNGLYYFVNRLSGLCLNVPGSAPGTQLDQQPYIGVANQQFAISLNASAAMQPSFFLLATPSLQSVAPGGVTSYTVTLTTNTGFAPPVTFSLTGLPTNSSVNFSLSSLSANGISTLTVTTSNNTPAGNYVLTISGGSSAGTNTASFSLSVVAPGSNLVWNSTSSAAWDTTTANWFNQLSSLNDVFQNDKNVIFTDANVVTNVTIANGVSVSPAIVIADADANNYSISGAGKITGATGLSKSGNGTLTLNTTNDFTGAVFIGDGMISTPILANGGIASGIGAGSSSVVLDGGTLQWTGGASVSVNRGFTLTLNGGTLDSSPPVSANLTLSGTIALSNSGPRTLVLAGTDPNPLVIGGNALSSIIADSGGSTVLEKDGNNAWNLSGVNTFSGGCVINGGRLRANTSAFAFGTGPVTVADGAQAYCNVGAIFPNAFFIQGIGIPETEGNYGALRLAANSCNVTNIITLVNDARITARGATTAGAIISGQITGDADLEFGNSGSGAGILTLSNSLNNWSGNTIISHGTVRLGAVDVIPHGADNSDVSINNSNPTNNSVFDLNGVSTTINGLLTTGGDFTRCIITNSSSTTATLTIGDNDANGNFGGIMKNGAGVVALTKTGVGVETLSGSNLYTGVTVVNNGTLIVSGSLAKSSVTVIAGAILGGSGTIGGIVTVNLGGTISPGNSIGVLTINNNVTLQGTTLMELNQSLGTNDVIRSNSSINYGGTLALTNLGGTFTTNDNFKLFFATTYNGTFTNIVPAIPAVNLAWSTNGLTNGVLSVIASPTPSPKFGAIDLTGNNFILSGSNGVPNWPCYLLASTNLVLPVSQWPCVATNAFDGGGNFSFTNVLIPDAPQRYYLLKVQ